MNRVLHDGKVLLRPMKPSDVDDRIYWETEDTEWQQWDGPWDYEGKSQEELKTQLEDLKATWLERIAHPVEQDPLLSLEICVDDETQTHIGWLGAYYIDDDCCIVENGKHLAVGITIVPQSVRRKGYAQAALTLYIRYLFDCGAPEVYTQTWSGNTRMICLAEKLGFSEYMRKKDLRLVRGQRYDGLTFRLLPDQLGTNGCGRP